MKKLYTLLFGLIFLTAASTSFAGSTDTQDLELEQHVVGLLAQLNA